MQMDSHIDAAIESLRSMKRTDNIEIQKGFYMKAENQIGHLAEMLVAAQNMQAAGSAL